MCASGVLRMIALIMVIQIIHYIFNPVSFEKHPRHCRGSLRGDPSGEEVQDCISSGR